MNNLDEIKAYDRWITLFNAPLYEKFLISPANYGSMVSDIMGEFSLRFYCIDCKSESVFHNIPDRLMAVMPQGYTIKEIPTVISFKCGMNDNHRIKFMFESGTSIEEFKKGNRVVTVMKTGQYPSIADLTRQEIVKYRKLMGEQFKELSMAIGLASHGVGVGSFVYLRRIIESLLEEARQRAIAEGGFDDNEFVSKRVVDKIQLVGKFLPRFLVENRASYSILSKGIHELGEEECKEYFPVLKTAITLTLDQKLAAKEAEMKEDEARRALQKIQQGLAGK